MSQKRYAPVAERFLYSIIAKMINFERFLRLWAKRQFQEDPFQPNAVFLGSRSVNNTTKKRAFTNQTLRSNNRQLAASLNAYKLSVAKLTERINELNGEILELRGEVSKYISCLISKNYFTLIATF